MVDRNNPLTRFLVRIRYLLTGNIEWEVPYGGGVEKEHLGWRTRWSLFGVHSYNWKWVRKLGERECGCTFHPLTKRRLLTRMDCVIHSNMKYFQDEIVEDYHGKARGSSDGDF
jgi:hypothetical protein